jgi:hypothetical protein
MHHLYIPDGERQTSKTARIAMPNLIFFIFSLQSFLSSLLRKISKMELISACPTLHFYAFDMEISWWCHMIVNVTTHSPPSACNFS